MMLKSFFNIINYSTDILMIVFNMIVKLTPPDALCVQDCDIIVRYCDDIYVHCIHSKKETVGVPNMKKIMNKYVKMIKIYKFYGRKYIFTQTQDDSYSMKCGVEKWIIPGNDHILGNASLQKTCYCANDDNCVNIMFSQINNHITDIDSAHNMCFTIFNGKLHYIVIATNNLTIFTPSQKAYTF